MEARYRALMVTGSFHVGRLSAMTASNASANVGMPERRWRRIAAAPGDAAAVERPRAGFRERHLLEAPETQFARTSVDGDPRCTQDFPPASPDGLTTRYSPPPSAKRVVLVSGVTLLTKAGLSRKRALMFPKADYHVRREFMRGFPETAREVVRSFFQAMAD